MQEAKISNTKIGTQNVEQMCEHLIHTQWQVKINNISPKKKQQ
jgi:hypothetical protein